VKQALATRFPPEALKFLRALKRNNRREWFLAHRDQYDTYVRGPMLELIQRLAGDLREFAPEIVCDPKTAMYRIYRDVRFSANKAPYKTHVAASFPPRGLPKHEGAGLYFHVSPTEVWVGGGMYAPQTAQLQAVREHVAAHVKRLRAIVESPGFRRAVGALEGERLQRVPRGFATDHPAAEFLRHRQFLAGRELDPDLATSPKFYPAVIDVFRHVAPLTRFLNDPLLNG
jgi:uncharacterized protein (TIGR02453 family)